MRRAKNFVGDARLLGRADWYVVRTARGRTAVKRKQDRKPGDVVLGGPYETKEQARCSR